MLSRRVSLPLTAVLCLLLSSAVLSPGDAQADDEIHARWRDFEIVINEYLVDRGTVVVLGAYRGAHRQTGKEMLAEFAHVYRVDEGRVVRFDQIADTWQMVSP